MIKEKAPPDHICSRSRTLTGARRAEGQGCEATRRDATHWAWWRRASRSSIPRRRQHADRLAELAPALILHLSADGGEVGGERYRVRVRRGTPSPSPLLGLDLLHTRGRGARIPSCSGISSVSHITLTTHASEPQLSPPDATRQPHSRRSRSRQKCLLPRPPNRIALHRQWKRIRSDQRDPSATAARIPPRHPSISCAPVLPPDSTGDFSGLHRDGLVEIAVFERICGAGGVADLDRRAAAGGGDPVWRRAAGQAGKALRPPCRRWRIATEACPQI